MSSSPEGDHDYSFLPNINTIDKPYELLPPGSSRGRSLQAPGTTTRTPGSSPARGRSSSNRPSPPKASRIPAPIRSSTSPPTVSPLRRSTRQHKGSSTTAQTSTSVSSPSSKTPETRGRASNSPSALSGRAVKSPGGRAPAAGSMGPPPVPSRTTKVTGSSSATNRVERSDESGKRPLTTVLDYQNNLKLSLEKMKKKSTASASTSSTPASTQKTGAGSSSTSSGRGAGSTSTQPPRLTGRTQSELQGRLSRASTQSASSTGAPKPTSPITGRRRRQDTSSESPPSDETSATSGGKGKGKARGKEKQPAKRAGDNSNQQQAGPSTTAPYTGYLPAASIAANTPSPPTEEFEESLSNLLDELNKRY